MFSSFAFTICNTYVIFLPRSQGPLLLGRTEKGENPDYQVGNFH